MKVTIVTVPIPYVAGRDEVTSHKEIDWANTSDRKWLTSHIHWAVHNNQSVTIHQSN